MESSPESAAPGPNRLSIEKFETLRIKRSQIQNAPYNPRTISESARRRLKQGLQKLGIMSPIVWNKRTGNIVSGHQRLSIMDQLVPKSERLEGGKDYLVTVSAVDLNDIEEREANLLFNNAAAQGDFDLDKLTGMLSMPDLDIEATGWDKTDMFRIMGHDNILAEQEQRQGLGEDDSNASG